MNVTGVAVPGAQPAGKKSGATVLVVVGNVGGRQLSAAVPEARKAWMRGSATGVPPLAVQLTTIGSGARHFGASQSRTRTGQSAVTTCVPSLHVTVTVVPGTEYGLAGEQLSVT